MAPSVDCGIVTPKTGASIVSDNGRVARLLVQFASCAVTSNVNVPIDVGVPLIVPFVSSARPAGSEPDDDQVTAPVPPVVLSNA